MYSVGAAYTRKAIYDLLSLPENERGGDWLNGLHRHGDDYYIFCNIGVPGRTGHDYDNHWEGEKLVWHGKNRSHFGQKSIQNLVSGKYRVLVFYRGEDRAPFSFAGVGRPIAHPDIEHPARVDWVFGSDDSAGAPVFTDEFVPGAKFVEGHRTKVLVNRYERDRGARDACIRHHKPICCVCGLDFGERYGEPGKGFIHVHHIVPVHMIGEGYMVDAVADLVPICPNCHAMVHRKNPPYTVEEVKALLR